MVALTAFGLFGAPQLQWAAALLPGVIAGLCVAPLLTGFLHPARLRLAILSIAGVSAILLLLRWGRRV